MGILITILWCIAIESVFENHHPLAFWSLYMLWQVLSSLIPREKDVSCPFPFFRWSGRRLDQSHRAEVKDCGTGTSCRFFTFRPCPSVSCLGAHDPTNVWRISFSSCYSPWSIPLHTHLLSRYIALKIPTIQKRRHWFCLAKNEFWACLSFPTENERRGGLESSLPEFYPLHSPS